MQLQNNQDMIRKNLHDFLEKYGKEGFLKLYFTNLLFEMVKDEIHTRSDSVKNSPGLQYYFNKEGNYENASKLEEFNKRLKNECMKKSELIVSLVEKKNMISKFGVDLNKITEVLSNEIEKQMKDIFKEVFDVKWGEEVEK